MTERVCAVVAAAAAPQPVGVMDIDSAAVTDAPISARRLPPPLALHLDLPPPEDSETPMDVDAAAVPHSRRARASRRATRTRHRTPRSSWMSSSSRGSPAPTSGCWWRRCWRTRPRDGRCPPRPSRQCTAACRAAAAAAGGRVPTRAAGVPRRRTGAPRASMPPGRQAPRRTAWRSRGTTGTPHRRTVAAAPRRRRCTVEAPCR